jgi:RNA polymerase sigma factor (sigma-70 family)
MMANTSPAMPLRAELETDSMTGLVRAAAVGDRDAWNYLVERYGPMVRNVARRYRLSSGDVEDVTQTVWLCCFQYLSRLREPRALPGWLKTITQREALRLSTSQARLTSIDPADMDRMLKGTVDDGSADMLQAEAVQAVRDSLDELSPGTRSLLILLHTDARPSYREISEVLGIPTGSIGPTRARSLAKLRRTTALLSYLDTTSGMSDSA